MLFTYGPNQSRKKVIYKENGLDQWTRYYSGAYEKEIKNGNTRNLYYIYAGDGLTAVYIKDNTGENMYYILKDHLGSIVGITDEAGNLLEELSYDAYGNRRNPADGSFTNVPLSNIIARGFTGHEHIDEFGLINMNGRVYDPVLGRFLSPDNYVQAPDYTQSLNRYTYCINNPLKYKDPEGEFFEGTLTTLTVDFFRTLFTGGLSSDRETRQAAWTEYDPTAEWSRTYKSWKIDIGQFKTDPNRTIAGRGLQLLSRFTWEVPQMHFGLIASHARNITGNVTNVDYYGGATLVNRDDPANPWAWGFTLGPYINTLNAEADPYSDELFRHEYGHTLQSRLVGPFYLTHVGLPSLIGQGLEDIGVNDHSREWYETQANRMSFRYFSNHDPNALNSATTLYGPESGPWIEKQGTPWDNTEYPRTYNPNWYWLFANPLPFAWWLLF
ncbi:MAG: RHS repeat-associated core domain-containing protein [Bacteroidia bacterium]|nr:RHS repeat-associated core domain-containing protein [Bacteroidia bacterium]